MKETFYFSHDYGARNDPKLIKLQMKLGHEGKGIYWDLIEMLYEQSGYLLMSEIETYSFDLRTTYERITDIINEYDLFKNDGEKFWSESVLERLKIREIKSNKARESVMNRWNNTNVIRSNKKRNTIKERKGKKIKVNNNDWRTDFNTYKTELNKIYQELLIDSKFIIEQEKFHPGVDISLSLEKAYVNFWSTDAGWKHKKKSRSNEIDWKSTLIKAIDMNKVYKPRFTEPPKQREFQRPEYKKLTGNET